MANQRNRGASSFLYDRLRAMPVGTIVTTDDAHKIMREFKPDSARQAASSAMSYLRAHGCVAGSSLKGNYQTIPASANGDGSKVQEMSKGDIEAIVIDDLLNAMAAAEPVLRRWKRIQAALEAVK